MTGTENIYLDVYNDEIWYIMECIYKNLNKNHKNINI